MNQIYDYNPFVGRDNSSSDAAHYGDEKVQFIETISVDNVGTYPIYSIVLVPQQGM